MNVLRRIRPRNTKCVSLLGSRIPCGCLSSEQKSNHALFVFDTGAHVEFIYPPLCRAIMVPVWRKQGMFGHIGVILLSGVFAGPVHAEWCDPPVAPVLTTQELAKEFREEFKTEFDQYFRDASRYTECLDAERARIFEEMTATAHRLARFLDDAEDWE